MKAFFSAIIILVLLGSFTHAQIVLEPEDIPSEPGTTMLYYGIYNEDGLQIDLGQSGADRYWDYSDYIFSRVDEDEVIEPEDGPHIDEFEEANRVFRSKESGMGLDIDDGVRYEVLDDDGWNLLGFSISEEQDFGIPLEFIRLNEPIQFLPMPAEYGDEWDWENEVMMTMEAPDTLDMFDSLDVTLTYDGSAEIDAWGTLNFPDGEQEVLRTRISVGGVVTAAGVRYVFGRRIAIDLGEVFALDATHTYKWFAEEYGEVMSITSRPGEENLDFELATKIRSRFFDDTQHFTDFTWTSSQHSIVVTGISANGEEVPAGWEVGVFTPEDILAGGGVWRNAGNIGFAAWADDPETDEVDGFRADEQMTFRIWDPESDNELAAETIVDEGNLTWADSELTVLALESGEEQREQTIALRDSWNIISLNVSPGQEYYAEGEDRGPDVILLMDELRIDEDSHHIQLLKDEYGHFYVPDWGFCNIPFWNLTEGYRVQVDEALEATWSGEPIAADADIPIAQGWNMIAYYPTYDLEVSAPDFYGISPIIDNVNMMKDDLGRFLINGDWRFSNMPPLTPGRGYQIDVSEEVVLNYPAPRDERNAAGFDLDDNESLIIPTSENMSLLISGFDRHVDAGTVIYAWSDNDDPVGVGTVDDFGRCGLAIWGDDPHTKQKEGLAAGENFRLTLTGKDVPLAVREVFKGTGLIYNKDDISIVSAGVQRNNVPEDVYLAQAYPNPFNNTTSITFGLNEAQEVNLAVYNLQGRLVKNIQSEFKPAGHHTVTWNANGLSSGIYIVRLSAGQTQLSRKVLLAR